MLRDILAILAGFAAMGIAAIGTDMILGRFISGEIQSTGMLTVILAYTLAYCTFGGFVTASIAQERALRASAFLAVLIAAMTILNLVMTPGSTPIWWKVLGGALSGPFAYLGGWLYSAGGGAGRRGR